MHLRAHKERLQEAPNILVHVLGNRPGRRIGVVKFYESGYYSTTADRENWTVEQVNAFVAEQNAFNGISEKVAKSALGASMFGWHVPAAKAAIEWFKQFRLSPEGGKQKLL